MTTREEITEHCKENGIELMGDVFDVILDREEATAEECAAFLDHHDPQTLYETYIVGGINNLSDAIQGGP